MITYPQNIHIILSYSSYFVLISKSHAYTPY